MSLKLTRAGLLAVFSFVLFVQTGLIAEQARAEEMIIGEERVEPGIMFIFEGAVKDHVMPMMQHLPEDQTDVHLEARVNWAEKKIPEGAPPGGFVAYLMVDALIRNQKTGRIFHASLTPHLNLIDNFHYARNLALPGKTDELYTVTFHVRPPEPSQLSFHKDWIDQYGDTLFKAQSFEYKDLSFEAIAKASR